MRTVLVLSGGGVRGMAHVGAWQAVREAGIEVSAIVGTSIGALVAACLGAGDSYEVLRQKALAFKKQDIALLNRWVVLLNGIRQPSVFRGDTIQAYVDAVVPAVDFEDLAIPVAINAVDLGSGAEVWFGAGGRSDVALKDAVKASCALPVFYPPFPMGAGQFVDGGVLDPLPLEHAAALGAERIIAIDVSGGGSRDAQDVVAAGLVAIHHRITEIMGLPRKQRLLESWQGPPLLYVRPQLDAYPTFDFEHTELFLSEGYRATAAALGLNERAGEELQAG
jgi:NTE family protein